MKVLKGLKDVVGEEAKEDVAPEVALGELVETDFVVRLVGTGTHLSSVLSDTERLLRGLQSHMHIWSVAMCRLHSGR